MRKEFAAAVILSLISLRADAAIAVVDAQNIAQTAKVYAETVKTVVNTAEQIKLQTQELLSLPTDILNEYVSSYTNMANQVTNTVNNATYNFVTNDITREVESYWNNKFGTLEVDVVTPEGVQKQEQKRRKDATAENKKYTEAHAVFLEKLNEEGKKLAELLKKSARAEGQKQSAQIANQIEACKANILRIQSNLHLMNSKRQLEKQEREISLQTEMANLAEAKAAAAKKYVESLDTTSRCKIEDFWKKK